MEKSYTQLGPQIYLFLASFLNELGNVEKDEARVKKVTDYILNYEYPDDLLLRNSYKQLTEDQQKLQVAFVGGLMRVIIYRLPTPPNATQKTPDAFKQILGNAKSKMPATCKSLKNLNARWTFGWQQIFMLFLLTGYELPNQDEFKDPIVSELELTLVDIVGEIQQAIKKTLNNNSMKTGSNMANAEIIRSYVLTSKLPLDNALELNALSGKWAQQILELWKGADTSSASAAPSTKTTTNAVENIPGSVNLPDASRSTSNAWPDYSNQTIYGFRDRTSSIKVYKMLDHSFVISPGNVDYVLKTFTVKICYNVQALRSIEATVPRKKRLELNKSQEWTNYVQELEHSLLAGGAALSVRNPWYMICSKLKNNKPKCIVLNKMLAYYMVLHQDLQLEKFAEIDSFNASLTQTDSREEYTIVPLYE